MERRMHILPNISHACKTKVRSPVMHCDNTYKLRGFSIPQAASPPPLLTPNPHPALLSIRDLLLACHARSEQAPDFGYFLIRTHARTHKAAGGGRPEGQAEEPGLERRPIFTSKEQGRVTPREHSYAERNGGYSGTGKILLIDLKGDHCGN